MKGGSLSLHQRARLQGYLERRPGQGPETVHIDIINACNLNCVTCWNYAPGLVTPKPAAWKTQRMDATVFARVLAEVAGAGASASFFPAVASLLFTHACMTSLLPSRPGIWH